MAFGVLEPLFGFVEKHLWPESYWQEEVDKAKSTIERKSQELQACTLKVAKAQPQYSKLYGDLVQKNGFSTQQALELSLTLQKQLDSSCDHHQATLLATAKKLAFAEAELARLQTE